MNTCAPYDMQLKRIRFSSVNSVDYVDAVDTVEIALKQVASSEAFLYLSIETIEKEVATCLKIDQSQVKPDY